MRPEMLKKPGPESCRSQPQMGQTSEMGRGRKGWSLFPLPGSVLAPSVLGYRGCARRLLPKPGITDILPGTYLPCLPFHERHKGWVLRVECYLPIPLPRE